jgi:hypothetical protein
LGTQITWLRPTPNNVKALWVRIRDGQFKTASGLPRFQLVKDIEDPEILFLTWTYDKMALVRCSLDDFPAYLPDEDPERLNKVLTRIAGRELRPPKVDLRDARGSSETLLRHVQEAVGIFESKLSCICLGAETESNVLEAFRETLDDMVERKMVKGT